jgi:hypothetical protein
VTPFGFIIFATPVETYVLGKQVVNTTISGSTVNVANLKNGVYIVKITENGKTATRKLVIR